MDIATGTPEDHPSLLPLDASTSPGVAPGSPVVPGQLAGPTIPARDAAAELSSLMAGQLAEATAAQAAGMSAEHDRRAGYEAQVTAGGQIGTNVVLPVVADDAIVPASSDQYPWPGDEPLPSSAGPTYGGNEPN